MNLSILHNRCRFLTHSLDRALTSYSNLTKSLDPASQSDIAAYRSWIAAHTPIDENESAFLHQGSDLLSITCAPRPGSSRPRATTALETPIVLVAFALLSTVVVFKVVPQLLGRLVISAMVGVGALCALSPEVMTDLKGVRDRGKAIATYVFYVFHPRISRLAFGTFADCSVCIGIRLSWWCWLLLSARRGE